MDNDKLSEYIDQHRWLLNNGLISDNVKNQLFFYGSIVHKDVQAVDLQINPEDKLIEYKIFVNKKVLKKIEKYNRLSTAKSLFDMWRFKRFLKKEGSLDFQNMLSSFVTDFCGPKWVAHVTVLDFDAYDDRIEDKDGAHEQSEQINKLSH